MIHYYTVTHMADISQNCIICIYLGFGLWDNIISFTQTYGIAVKPGSAANVSSSLNSNMPVSKAEIIVGKVQSYIENPQYWSLPSPTFIDIE